MTDKEILEQLEDIKEYAKENMDDDDPCDVWSEYLKACRIAQAYIEEILDEKCRNLINYGMKNSGRIKNNGN